MTRLRSRIHPRFYFYLYHCTRCCCQYRYTPAEGTVTATKLADPFGTYSGVGGFTLTGIVSATEIRGDGRFLTGVSAGKFVTETAGIVTNTSVGINTSTVDDNDLTGIGNSFQGLYISNGMVIHDNRLNGVHYIGTAFNGLMGLDQSLSVEH